jgi:hypothetical protein
MTDDQRCDFKLTEDPNDIIPDAGIDELYFWVESDRLEARKGGKILDVDTEKIKKTIVEECVDDPNGTAEMEKPTS